MATVKSLTKVFNARISNGVIYENYRVEFDAMDSDPTDIYGAADPNTGLTIPSFLDYTANGRGIRAYAVNFEPQQQSALVYIVQMTYDPTTQPPPEGLHWAVDFSIRLIPVIVEVGKDADGNVMKDSAGEPYKGIHRTLYDEEITVTYKSFAPPVDAIEDCIGTINSEACSFTIDGITRSFDAQTVKMTDAEYSTSFDFTTGYRTFWNVMYKFLQRIDTWQEVVDEGTYYLDPDGNHIEAPTGGNVLLDGSGHQLPDGHDPEYNYFYLDNQADFNPLFVW